MKDRRFIITVSSILGIIFFLFFKFCVATVFNASLIEKCSYTFLVPLKSKYYHS